MRLRKIDDIRTEHMIAQWLESYHYYRILSEVYVATEKFCLELIIESNLEFILC